MGIDIRALASSAIDTAQDLADQAFEDVTIRTGPTSLPNPATNSSIDSWANEFTGVNVLGYDDEEERRDRDSEKRMKVFLVDRADILAAVTADPSQLEQTAQITDSASKVWEAYRVDFDPTRSVIMFYCER